MALTNRQSEILKAIIEEHIECAQPIASVELVEKRGLSVSGATVRNVMADLVDQGFLDMLHVSSGRTPTDAAYRYYITELMDEDEISVLDELALKQKIWEERFEVARLLRNTAVALSEATGSLAISLSEDGFITYAGTSRILDIPEFYEIDVTKSVLKMVDDYELARSILAKTPDPSGVTVLIGREIGLANMEPVSVVSSRTQIADKECFLGVIGPARIKYHKVIPFVRYTSQILKEVGQNL